MIRNSIYIFLAILFAGCESKTFDSKTSLLRYVSDEDNHLSYQKTINGIDFILQYRPTDEMVAIELGESKDQKKINELRTKYYKYMYFNLSMSKNNQELLSDVADDQGGFSKLTNELLFEMGEKVHLFSPEKDTLAITDFIYPRMYAATKSTSIMFIYPRDKKLLSKEYMNFTIEDLGFHTGEIKFKINTNPIKNEPSINF